MFSEDYEQLSHSDQLLFKRVVNNLLYRCYIVRRVYDRTIKMNKISPDFSFIERHFDMLSDYLSYMDMELVKDDDNGVCFLTSDDDSNKIRIDGATTLITYALRSYYEEKLKENPSSNDVYLDSTSLKLLLKDLGLSTPNRRFSVLTISSSLRFLNMYNIITLAKGSLSESTYAIYILPSIRYVISNAKLNSLYSYITENPSQPDQAANGGLFQAEEEKDENPDSIESTDVSESSEPQDNALDEADEVKGDDK